MRIRRAVIIAVVLFLALLTVVSFLLLITSSSSDAATLATLFAGALAADVVVWQGYLIKRQLAFSTYLDLDKEWNSQEMIEARQRVHTPDSDEWDYSRLETILEFLEKLSLMFRVSGDMRLLYRTTLGWYASRYFLFARHHGQIDHLRELWSERVYGDIEDFYDLYLSWEVGRSKGKRANWEKKCLATEMSFWNQEQKD